MDWSIDKAFSFGRRLWSSNPWDSKVGFNLDSCKSPQTCSDDHKYTSQAALCLFQSHKVPQPGSHIRDWGMDETISKMFVWNLMVETQQLCAFPSWHNNNTPTDLIPIDQHLENSQWFAPHHAQAPVTGGHQMTGPQPRSLSQLGYRNWWEDVESMCQVDTWRIAPLGKFIIVLTNPG